MNTVTIPQSPLSPEELERSATAMAVEQRDLYEVLRRFDELAAANCLAGNHPLSLVEGKVACGDDYPAEVLAYCADQGRLSAASERLERGEAVQLREVLGVLDLLAADSYLHGGHVFDEDIMPAGAFDRIEAAWSAARSA